MNKNIKVIVTGGGCIEQIDSVRSIRNSSSGKLSAQIIDELPENIEVTYIHGLKSVMPNRKVKDVPVAGVMELYDAMKKELESKPDFVVHAMAVSDYTVDYVSTAKMLADSIRNADNIEDGIVNNDNVFDKDKKLSSYEDNIIIKLKKSPKVIHIIKELSPKTCLIGFKLLSGVSEEELISVATALKEKNHCDYVVANDIKNISATEHQALLIGNTITKLHTKKEIAEAIKEVIYGNYKDD